MIPVPQGALVRPRHVAWSPSARWWPGGPQRARRPARGLRPGELREKAVQGEVVPVSVLLGPFL